MIRDLLHLEGKVVGMAGAKYVVNCSGASITAQLTSHLKFHNVRVLPGDHVRVKVSPYDLSHGLIEHREK